jgi:hypothetical protein
MSIKKLLFFVGVLTIAATGLGKAQQQATDSDAAAKVSPDATTDCTFTFTSGGSANYLQFCVTSNGNIVELRSPQPYEHIREGTFYEGYGICDFGSLTRYVDWAATASTNWLPATISGNHLPVTIKRTTSDGIYSLTQVISRNTSDPAVTISMTLKNNTAASHDFSLLRYADIDANNANLSTHFDNWFDFDHESAWGYNPGFNLFGVMLYSVPTNQPHFAFVQNRAAPPDPCSPVDALPSSTPFFGDGSVGMDWNGTLKAHQEVTVLSEYKRF